MLTSAALKKIVAEARPLIEQQLDLTEQVAGLRDVVTAAGGDWSQLKALVKAQIQDERDEAGDGKRVRKILDKADYAASYADMLGLANMNEKNSFAEGDSDPAFDRWLEEVADRVDPTLLIQIIEGSKSAAGRAIIMAAIKVVKEERAEAQPPHDPETGEIIETGRHGAGGAEDDAQVATERAPSSANSSRAKAAHAASRGEDVGQHQASSDPGKAGAGEPGRHNSASADADPANNSVPRHEVEEADEGEVTPPASSVPHSDIANTISTEPASPPSEIAEPGDRGAVVPSAAPVVADNSNIQVGKKRWTFNDPAHPDCLDTAMCGGFSNLKLCQRCREAAAVGQVA